jgi:hypothetical protein
MQTQGTTLTQRLADAADLIIDFATLGEYGLEPVDQPRAPQCGPGRRRTARHSAPRRSTAALATVRR